ncbi:hypothetical protein LVD15_01860 [Fulvivirga maritima]|uniref:hypothetical protein n=1 Tax=Fulvivirga maritima TaxID=2904247 RepID=UPI001F2055B2|nr:hypothetical protein [Fulvivirga maritima]UII27195.1 hypothetical protein LVD15_01860 [Fulvivirga maritima]
MISCDSDDTISTTCELNTLINSNEYENAPSNDVTINNLEISGDCLTITFSASGCDGESWEYKLIDSETIDFLVTADEPSTGRRALRTLRLSLKDDEYREALITKTISFDISNLKVEGENSVELNIANGVSSVMYEY